MTEMGDAFRAMKQDRQKRNRARVGIACSEEPRISRWCEEYGVLLKVSNFGAHWHFSCADKQADWWPGTTRLVLDGKTGRPKFRVSPEKLLRCLLVWAQSKQTTTRPTGREDDAK